jgi:hypothetical protein
MSSCSFRGISPPDAACMNKVTYKITNSPAKMAEPVKNIAQPQSSVNKTQGFPMVNAKPN